MIPWFSRRGAGRFFRSSELIISEEDAEWQHSTYRWLIAQFNSPERNSKRRLVLPTRDYFPDQCESPWDSVTKTFGRVIQYAGMEEQHCLLQPQETDPSPHVAQALLVQGAPQGPAGTFRLDDAGRPIITFNPALMNDPQGMVATFAHELAHLLLSSATEPPPGGLDNLEFATDLAAVFLGFGIFLANTSFRFNQFGGGGVTGWKAQRQGYLTGGEILHALAIFTRLFESDSKEPEEFIKSSSVGLYRRALRSLDASSVIEELREVKCDSSAASRKLPGNK